MSRRLPSFVALAFLAVWALVGSLMLSGCSGHPDPYPAKTAANLQSEVLAVTRSSATGDYTAAMRQLDELTVSLKDRLARGTLGRDRYNSISAAVTLVRGDLEAAIAAQQQELLQQQQEQKQKPPGKNKGKDKG